VKFPKKRTTNAPSALPQLFLKSGSGTKLEKCGISMAIE
jgi:hypothetical protein